MYWRHELMPCETMHASVNENAVRCVNERQSHWLLLLRSCERLISLDAGRLRDSSCLTERSAIVFQLIFAWCRSMMHKQFVFFIFQIVKWQATRCFVYVDALHHKLHGRLFGCMLSCCHFHSVARDRWDPFAWSFVFWIRCFTLYHTTGSPRSVSEMNKNEHDSVDVNDDSYDVDDKPGYFKRTRSTPSHQHGTITCEFTVIVRHAIVM